MVSDLRQNVWSTLEKYRKMLEPHDWSILDVGTAGDPPRPDGKPGGNYQFFGEDNNYKTIDVSEKFHPDYVDDICKTSFNDDLWDLVVLSQTLEHIYTPKKAIAECYRIIKPEKFLIVDSPWMYPYHAEFNYDDYFRYSATCLRRMCETAGFIIIDVIQTDLLSSVLVQKPKTTNGSL